MFKKFQFFIALFIVLTILFGFCFNSAAEPNLSFDSHSLVAQKRIGRSTYEYTYTAKAINTGTDAYEVRATVTSNSPNTIILENEVSFGTIYNGSTVTSTDTYTFKQNRRYLFDPNSLIWSFSYDLPVLIPQVELTASPTTINQGEQATLTWTSINADTVYIEPGIGIVSANDTISVNPEHTTTYTISATGIGGSASEKMTIVVNGTPEVQPAGSFGEQYNDIVPTDATIESYDSKRFSLATGLVRDISGNPIIDVSITVFNHPEYGTAKTDTQGRFTIPVQGGGILKFIYQKQEYITSHRQVNVPWNDFAIIETIQMITKDSASSTLTFDGNPDTIITHRSTPVTDTFGSRSCSMVFSGDNQAFLVDENGNDVQELTTITTRATEYTTPESMPAKLPPNSAYTYCAELSVDGAQRVRFAKPVITWVNNFLGFDVGEVVPVGYYDRDRGVWVPSDNGVVVKLLDMNSDGIVDSLDTDGDDIPNDLNENGSFSDEVTGLDDNTIYLPGTTFWRVALSHFTPWDCNWPWGLPPGATGPNSEDVPTCDQQLKAEDDCNRDINSYIEDRSRIFHEDIPIPGTDMTLHYASNRSRGYKTSVINVPVSGDTIPSGLKRIIVKLQIAGNTFEKTLDPLHSQLTWFVWDGLDGLGNVVANPVEAKIIIGFEYGLVYYGGTPDLAQSFGQVGSNALTIVGRQDAIVWKEQIMTVYPGSQAAVKSGGFLAEGWTLSGHHFGSTVFPTLFKGNGVIVESEDIDVISTVAGNYSWSWSGYGDGSPATEISLYQLSDLTVDAVGNFYFSDGGSQIIRMVDTNGIITTIAGNTHNGFSGDGWSATEAKLGNPDGICLDVGGNLYIADSFNARIRKVDTEGIITTIAGNGTFGYSGDGGPATDAQLEHFPSKVFIDPAGNLYISSSNRIRKVDVNGIISTYAGNGISGHSGDNGPAIEASLMEPEGMCMDSAGNLYIACWASIRKVDPSGIITTVAGTGTSGYSGDGGPAVLAQVFHPEGIVLDTIGNLYIGDSLNHVVRKVDTSGIITTIAGIGINQYGGDGGTPVLAGFTYPKGIGIDGAGNIYIADQAHRVRKINKNMFPTASIGEISFAEENGLGHIMYSDGRHLKTIDLGTGIVLREFDYDGNNNLITITNRFGQQITINRDTNGTPTSITSPDGVTTFLTIDADNNLKQISYEDGSTYNFEYTPDGLMTAEIEPNGNRFEHLFDLKGRLTDVSDQEGSSWNYTRTMQDNGDILTEVLSAEGDLTTYLDHTYSTGAYESTITGPAGSQTLFTQSADGLTANKSLACGMDLEFKYDLDPEYKFKYVKEMREKTPSLLEKVTLKDKTYQDTDSDTVPDLITETLTVNGKPTTIVNNTILSTRALTSPTGRTVTEEYNPATLLTTNIAVPGLDPTSYEYDSKGRLTISRTNTRQTNFAYNGKGFLESVTDPENHTTLYGYDEVGRVTSIDRPDGSSIGFVYDANGNMTVLTNPTEINHDFGYNKVNYDASYDTPLSGSYNYVYDKDRRLVQTNLPSGNQINNIYTDGRLEQIQTPEGNIDFTYLCGSKIDTITKGIEAVAYEYDGKLVTSKTQTGTLNQAVAYTYNNDFNLDSFTYAGSTENYAYDNDGLLTGAGVFAITRNSGNGLPVSVTGGALNLARTFNGYGEPDTQSYTISGQNLTDLNLTRNNNGRITTKIETVNGATSDYIYTFDPEGRLLTVKKDSTLVEEYRYDLNGTRNYEMNSLRGIAGRNFAYSDGDHLLTAGTTQYDYNLDGFLTTKVNGTGVTTYDYSSNGELLSVALPDGRQIEYIHDPLGRRIAKKVDGVITEKYLWQGLTRLLAVYDGSNNLTMRFRYADGRMPVSMEKQGTTYYLACDQVGSLKLITDASGNVIKKIEYDSFGNVINDSAPAFEIPFGFAGGLYDTDTGLVRFGYRDYDPDIGRWTAKDPILFAGGDTDLYGYVLNDPINYIDPLGLWSLTLDAYPIGIGGGIVVGQNPNGEWFLSGRAGYGIGGGFSFDEDGTSPDPCELKTGPKVASLGVFGEGNLSLGILFWGFLTNTGVSVNERREINEYGNTGPTDGASLNFGVRGTFAAGFEGTLHLNSFLRYLRGF